MRQFTLWQLLESTAWLSLGLAATKAFIWANSGEIFDDGLWRWREVIIILIWFVGGVSFGNVIAAFTGRRLAWSILGVCWTFFVVLTLITLEIVRMPF